MRRIVAGQLLIGLAVAAFFGWTAGVDALQRDGADRPVAGAELAVPSIVYDPPQVLADTEHNGPPGPVAIAFRGNEARHGLSDSSTDPWIVVSAATGDYRVLAAPHLPARGEGPLVVAPDGRALAWGWNGGVVVYDPVSGESRELAGELSERPRHLVWSGSGDRLAFYAGGAAQVLDAASGELTAVPGLSEQSERHLAFGPGGETLVASAPTGLSVVNWRSGQRQRIDAALGRVVGLRGGPESGRVAVLSIERFGNPVRVLDPGRRSAPVQRVAPERLFVQQLVGWLGDNAFAVVALSAQTGPLRTIYQVSVDDASYSSLVTLPDVDGTNWTDSSTMSVATGLLQTRVADLGEPNWPWDPRAKLSALVLVTFFLLGYLVLMKPRRWRTSRRR
jgi:hypothetical protein